MEEKQSTNITCECPSVSFMPSEYEVLYSKEEKEGINHEPNKCKGTNEIKPYKRGTKILYLCSCCNVFGDIQL